MLEACQRWDVQRSKLLTRKRATMMVARMLMPAMKYAYTHSVVEFVSGPIRHVLHKEGNVIRSVPVFIMRSCQHVLACSLGISLTDMTKGLPLHLVSVSLPYAGVHRHYAYIDQSSAHGRTLTLKRCMTCSGHSH